MEKKGLTDTMFPVPETATTIQETSTCELGGKSMKVGALHTAAATAIGEGIEAWMQRA